MAHLIFFDCFNCDDSVTYEPHEQVKPKKISLNPKAPKGDLHVLAKMFYEQLSDTDAAIEIRN